MRKIYVAVPYGHSDTKVIWERMKIFDEVVIALLTRGYMVFSGCLFHRYAGAGRLPGNWDFWKEYSIEQVNMSDKLVVLTLEGWEESVGVQGEIETAREKGIPIEYVDLDCIEDLEEFKISANNLEV